MRRFLHYPFLLIVAVVTNRVIFSSMQISPTESLRSLAVFLVVAGIASAVIYHHVRDWHRTDFLIASFVLLILVYQAVYRWLKYSGNPDIPGLILIPCFTMFYFTANRNWQRLIRNPVQFTQYVNIVVILLLAIQIIQFGAEFLPVLSTKPKAGSTAILPSTEGIHLDSATRPDMYILVLDGYGRQDVLKEIYDYDNSGFINQLKQRGFYIADNSHSNYLQTPYAIASLMNFDYAIPWSPPSDYADYLMEPIQNNRVFKLLKDIGYTTISFDATTSYTQIKNSDVFYSYFLPLNKFEVFLLEDTPLEPLTNAFGLGLPIPNYETHRYRALNKLKNLQSVPVSVPGPKITYFHILVPHPPFVFDENGNPIEPARPYSIMDGNDFAGSLDEYWTGYRGQVVFINKEIIETVDSILSNSKNPPIIVIMSDHGPGSMFNWDIENPGCLWERAHNFYAVLLPGRKDNALHAGMTPVNTFRVIFNAYFGTNLPLLDDRTYQIAWQYPSTLADITDLIESTAGCQFQNR